MNVDCRDLLGADPVLYSQLVNYPGEVIPLFDGEANAMAAQLAGTEILDLPPLRVRLRPPQQRCLPGPSYLHLSSIASITR